MTTSTSTTSATTSFKSGSINISGLGNGTDFNSLIDGLVEAESYNKTQMKSWKAEWQAKVKGFQALNTKLLALKTTLGGMDTVNEFLTKTVSSTNSSAVSATADSDSLEGTHSVVVGQLAQTDILTTSTGVSALTSSICSNATSLAFSYAGQQIVLSGIGAGTTLTGLVNYINNNAQCSGKIKATTIYDGSSYHLQLYGLDQGAANQVFMSNTGSLVFGVSNFVNTQQAQSARIKVDGFPVGSGSWIERDSNIVDDVMPGVSLTLKEADPDATIQIGITTDTDAIKENIQNFVDAVNEVRSFIKALTLVSNSSGTTAGSLLTGNYGVQMISSQLKDVIADMGMGFMNYNSQTNSGDFYSALAQVGITTDADESSSTNGLLVLDEDALDAALSQDADGVAKLFAANYEGESESQDFSYLSRVNGTTKAGSYEVKVVTSATGISSATINGVKAGIDGWKITGLSGAAAGLVVQLENHTPGSTFTGTVDLKLGKAGEMVNTLKDLTNSTTGPLAILEDNYGDIMSDIDDKIARETQRLTALKTRLQNQYARLDSLLSTLSSTQTQLTSTIKQLSSS